MLYPLKFKPQYKVKVWGNSRIKEKLNRQDAPDKCGESWEISALEGDVSVVSNGFLSGNNLQEIIEVYMDDIVGKTVFDKYGIEFPLLIKFLDANEQLSIQVHPDDEMAKEKHHAYGKTEMWYVLDADTYAEIIMGFNRKVEREEFEKKLATNEFLELLNVEKNLKRGDVFYIPAGRIHSLGKGLLVAEIQQTSDITYRLYDWDRVGLDGKPRELHTDLALDAIDYSYFSSYKTEYSKDFDTENKVVNSKYFSVNYLNITKPFLRDFNEYDTFVIYMAIDKGFSIEHNGEKTEVKKGETVLVPAAIPMFTLVPENGQTEVLEIFINNKKTDKNEN